MLIISHVCVDFHDEQNNLLFRVKAQDLLKPLEAPESIMKDPIFRMLVKEGTLSAVESKTDRKLAENNPEKLLENQDISADNEEKKETKPAAKPRTSGKTEAKPEA